MRYLTSRVVALEHADTVVAERVSIAARLVAKLHDLSELGMPMAKKGTSRKTVRHFRLARLRSR